MWWLLGNQTKVLRIAELEEAVKAKKKVKYGMEAGVDKVIRGMMRRHERKHFHVVCV